MYVFFILFLVFQDNLEVYLGLQQFIVILGLGYRLNIIVENDCWCLYCFLRDLSFLLQVVGCLVEYFIGDVFVVWFNDVFIVVERLVKVIFYGFQIKLYNIEIVVLLVLKFDFIDVYVQFLVVLQVYFYWLVQYCSEVYWQNMQQFVIFIFIIMDVIILLISIKV